MQSGSVFLSNRTQAVRLPVEARFPEQVKRVNVRVLRNERILTPIENTWDSFFLSENSVSDDFINERATQTQSEREAF